MDLFDNPFFLLNATPRDRKAKLYEMADNLALHGDQDAAANARSILTNPRNRLAAEVAWFPGLSPKRVDGLLEHVRNCGAAIALDGIPPLCQANMLAGLLFSRTISDAEQIRDLVANLANQIEEVDAQEVMLALNEDRQAAGFPLLLDPLLVEEEVASRCRHYQRAITSILDEFPSDEMVSVYEQLISDSSLDGDVEAPRLINDLIDAYELHAGEFLTEEAARIEELIESTRAAANQHASEDKVRRSVFVIVESLKAWDRVAQPIQLSRKSRGLDHDESNSIAFSARSLAIDLFNEHDYLGVSKLLSNTLKQLFAEVAVVSDRVEQDVITLTEIEKARAQQTLRAAKEDAEFAAAVHYETSFGLIFKDKFLISASGIDYRGHLTPLNDITGVSWGAVNHYRNGISTGTTYHLRYCARNGITEIQAKDQHQYQQITSKLWRAVCVRILGNMLNRWGKGEAVRIGDVEVRDDGIVLSRTRLFKADEQQFFRWAEMSKSASNGSLNFYSLADKAFTAAFSYKDTLNAHIFDFAIDRIWEGKANKLSRIFGDPS